MTTDGVGNAGQSNRVQQDTPPQAPPPDIKTYIAEAMSSGMTYREAVASAYDSGLFNDADIDWQALNSDDGSAAVLLGDMSEGDLDGLPAVLREFIETLLGKSESNEGPQGPLGEDAGDADAPAYREAAGGRGNSADAPAWGRQDAPPGAARGEPPLGNAAFARSEFAAMAGNAPTSQAAALTPAQAAAQAAAERPALAPTITALAERPVTTAPLAPAQTAQLVRPGEAAIPAARPDAAAQLTQAQQQAVAVVPHVRAEVPLQALPQAATLALASQATPQGTTATPTLAGPSRGGDTSAMQARGDAQLAPAGHTVATHLRRDGRGQRQAPQGQRENALLALMLPIRKRAAGGTEEHTSFQWLFWLLTIVAYGGLIVAVIALLPGGHGLGNGVGGPGLGGYALLAAATAAAASWWIGKRLANR